jgi:hypothetical protein
VSGPSIRNLASHHLTEAIRHLSAAAAFARELAGREDSDDLAQLALVVDGTIETIRDARGAVKESRAAKDADAARLVAELEALPSYRGWRFAYEYPGLFCYHQPDGGTLSVFFTPDWSGDQELQVEVQTEDGECRACEVLPLPREGRTGQKIFEMVRPTLDKLSAAHPEAHQS